MTMTVDELQHLARQVSDIYAERFGVERDATWYLGKLSEELGEVTAAYLKLNGQGRTAEAPEVLRRNLEDELGDLFGFLLLFAEWQGVDLPAALVAKWGKYLEPAE